MKPEEASREREREKQEDGGAKVDQPAGGSRGTGGGAGELTIGIQELEQRVFTLPGLTN